MEFIVSNARIVTRCEVIYGSVRVLDGVIKEVAAGTAACAGSVDFAGDFLLPGLIELHTDNLEKNIQPRPGVVWPSMTAAVLAHDLQMAGAGITTVFDAIALGGLRSDSLRARILSDSMAAIRGARNHGILRAEHWVHLRCEIADPAMEEMLTAHGSDPLVRLISIMDHTPGQRQWSDLEKWRQYHRDKKWTAEEAEDILQERLELQRRHAVNNRGLAVQFAHDRQIPLASHDDTTAADCRQAAAEGMAIAEFPTTLTAARQAREAGMAVVMGAPNAVRGQSHSGNIQARVLASLGLLDGLSSDYVPMSLLHAAFALADHLGSGLPATIAMISANIAQMVGLRDRGEIAPGKRADLIRVTEVDNIPAVRSVWRQGHKVV